ncbi:MAG TPA: hypothetical protein VEU29_06880, partial [Actinomycetota bacterium]|nr:hypothetical protein [Actinomycetota bacterium]
MPQPGEGVDAAVPDYTMSAPDEPVELYEGPLTVRQGRAEVSARGRLALEWLPQPMVRFEVVAEDETSRRAVAREDLALGHASVSAVELGATVEAAVMSTDFARGAVRGRTD